MFVTLDWSPVVKISTQLHMSSHVSCTYACIIIIRWNPPNVLAAVSTVYVVNGIVFFHPAELYYNRNDKMPFHCISIYLFCFHIQCNIQHSSPCHEFPIFVESFFLFFMCTTWWIYFYKVAVVFTWCKNNADVSNFWFYFSYEIRRINF